MKHKNFVSMAALLILALSAVFLVTACPTGTGPSSGSNSGGTLTPPAVSAEETELTALLGKISLNKAIITTAPETITISDLPSIPEATVGIASNNIELIEYKAPNQLKVKALPTETADVKITITLTKNGISKSRDFTVKVFKSGDTPTEDDYFNTLTIPTTVSDDFDLPKELKNTESTAITWSTENENIIKIENSGTNPKALIAFDIVERKVKLKATVNRKSKKFEVTVLPVVKIEINNGPNDKKVYEFTQNGITIKGFQDDKLLRGTLYSYTLDDANKKITVRLTSVFSPEYNKWTTIEEYYSLIIDMQLTREKDYLESIDALLSKPTISISDLKKGLKNYSPADISKLTDKQVFERILKRRLGMEYNDFILLNSQEQTEKIKTVLTRLKKEMAIQYGLPEASSIEDILAEVKKLYQQNYAQEIKEAKEPCTYTYSIVKNSEGNLSFETKVVYNPSKPWYENRGDWNYHPASPETSWISSINARKSPNGTIEGGLSIQENHNHKSYHGTITGNGSSYTFNGSTHNTGEQITATITDNKDGTIKVKVTSGGTAESTLTFRGNPL
ncbi:hypothetical protein E4N80_08365 [Treponema denticola]|uniref:hypothetical protein n=1 Tax=Treponema denticola TaxID=158 RepID=UPI0020A282A3|nr:hypothetical protein [Treponema denticola]UTD05491.1 hypothetical protein E4N80_08365 [Treponema denticola]